MIKANESRQANQQHGLARSLLSNMVVGVDTGFTTTLQAGGRPCMAPLAHLCLPFNLAPGLLPRSHAAKEMAFFSGGPYPELHLRPLPRR